MGVSLIQPCRMSDEGLKDCKALKSIEIMISRMKAPANFVPAAAVIRWERVLFGFNGRKGHLGGSISCLLNLGVQLH